MFVSNFYCKIKNTEGGGWTNFLQIFKSTFKLISGFQTVVYIFLT